jgi:hypothetical protein
LVLAAHMLSLELPGGQGLASWRAGGSGGYRHDDMPGVAGQPRRVALEELVRAQGMRPIQSIDELACDVLESDEELDEFIAYTYAVRRSGLA